jgi:hypothetical protein
MEFGEDEHEMNGFTALTAKQARRLANLDLNPEIDFSEFRGLDFEAISTKVRQRGRRARS